MSYSTVHCVRPPIPTIDKCEQWQPNPTMMAETASYFSVVHPLELLQGRSCVGTKVAAVCCGKNRDFVPTAHVCRELFVRASSVLQRNVKIYGPMHALQTKDGSTCWNSDSCHNDAKQQSLVIDFQRPVLVNELRFQFQAGFTAETCHVQLLQTTAVDDSHNHQWVDCWQDLELEDSLELQTFVLTRTIRNGPQVEVCVGSALKLTFEDFTDFYGRITVYRIEVWGKEEH